MIVSTTSIPAPRAAKRRLRPPDFAWTWLLIACLVLPGATVQAGEAVATPPPQAADAVAAPPAKPALVRDRPTASTLEVFNRPIVTFRASALGVPPQERVANSESRIFAQLERGGDGTITIQKSDIGDVVKIDGALAFVVVEGDVEPLSGATLDTVTGAAVAVLKLAIAETREARDVRRMLIAAAWAGGATVIYLVLLGILRRAGRVVRIRMLRLAETATEKVRIGGTAFLNRGRAIRLAGRMAQAGFWTIVALMTYQWAGYVLSRFPYTRPWGEELHLFLVTTTIQVLTVIARSVPDLLIVAVIAVIARGVNGMLASFFDGVQSRRIDVGWLDVDSARPTRRLATFAVWVFALAMAYPYIPGSNTEAFKGVSVLVGLMISIGASGIVGQAASGLILMYTGTFRTGEYVKIGDNEGTIVEMGMFTTRMRTGLGAELEVPNAFALSNVSTNYSRAVKGEGFVVDTTVTIGYDAPWRQVQSMLIEAALRTRGVLAAPEPRVFQVALSDFYVEYRLVCQAVPGTPSSRAEVMSTLHANVQDVFNESGVQIMSPHYRGDPAEPKIVLKANWHETPGGPAPG